MRWNRNNTRSIKLYKKFFFVLSRLSIKLPILRNFPIAFFDTKQKYRHLWSRNFISKFSLHLLHYAETWNEFASLHVWVAHQVLSKKMLPRPTSHVSNKHCVKFHRSEIWTSYLLLQRLSIALTLDQLAGFLKIWPQKNLIILIY